jgi:3-deoxy-D-manno-octulosonic acid kinase
MNVEWCIREDQKPLFTQELKDSLITLCLNPKNACPSRKLAGRVMLEQIEIPGIGSCMVKSYRRGGIVGKIFGFNHYRSSTQKSRALLEFEALQYVRGLGVFAPKPVAALWTTGRYYRSWLVMEEIKLVTPLEEIALHEPMRLPAIFQSFLFQLDLLVAHKFLHTDLHPGNVLVGHDNTIWILDFDKSEHFKGNERELRRKYLSRWRRAVLKHGLPDTLIEYFSQGLLKISHDK